MSYNSSSCILGKKRWRSSHGSAYHSQLRYDLQHLWRSMVQWRHQLLNRTKLWLFLDALVAFALLLADLRFKIDNSTYLRIHWAKNELRRRTQFFDKEVGFQSFFQEHIPLKFCFAASILVPAVFWKASHINPSAKLSTLLSNGGPFAANGYEWIIDGHL